MNPMPPKKNAKNPRALKPAEPAAHIDGEFDLVACDLSLTCPGFARLRYDPDAKSVTLKAVTHVSNRR